MPNELAGESSPYLLQHQHNPVDWHPWTEKALQMARARDCPILLSIGYSACHWCHVMAHESFEDEHTAKLMNELFVNIKVDREERPDLDQVYQAAHLVLSRQAGGWPLTIFLEPQDLLPLHTGTYFPATPRHGMPAFQQVLRGVYEAWQDKREALIHQSVELRKLLHRIDEPPTHSSLPAVTQIFQQGRKEVHASFDQEAGGFGNAPKFPMPTLLSWLLHSWFASNRLDREVLAAVTHTLTRMSRGGIFDHLGGGFYRYSTDRHWVVPHFEKMLYDNGLLLSLYADVLGIHKRDALFADTLTRTADWLMTRMQSSEGGYYAAMDADSEGQEGRYYLWHRMEIRELLDDDEYLVAETLFGLDKPANFAGLWNLRRHDAWTAVARRLNMEQKEADRLLEQAVAKLLAARDERQPPGLDDKIICAWNGLAIKGMVQAGQALDRPDWIDSAARAVLFAQQHAWRDDRLHSVWTRGDSKPWGFLNDYAYLLDGVLKLLESRWNPDHVRFAVQLAKGALARFQGHNGLCFFTASDHEELIWRARPLSDDVMPAGNAVLAHSLLRLGHLLAEPDFLDAADALLRAAMASVAQAPGMHAGMLIALSVARGSCTQVILQGPETDCQQWLAACRHDYRPDLFCYAIPAGADSTLLPYLPMYDGAGMRAYLCRNLACEAPLTDLDDLLDRLEP